MTASEILTGDQPEPHKIPIGLSPQRRELLNWFRINAEPLAPAYEGAIRMLDDRDFPARVHFIAHAVRDISNRLIEVLEPGVPAGMVQYAQELDAIEKVWPDLHSMSGKGSDGGVQEAVELDYKLALRIDGLGKIHRESRKRPSNREMLFRFLMRNEPNRVQLNIRLVSGFEETCHWFMKLAHLRNKVPALIEEDKLQTQFAKFEGMLHSFVGDFFTGTETLDEILHEAN
ncbi:MAG: hypothetical protein IID09_03660, partial [Candidatus Hydrogenedentes bacterium]|nr:hypothetical protein [Candidatus Hydrogenedentota bacterium]